MLMIWIDNTKFFFNLILKYEFIHDLNFTFDKCIKSGDHLI